MSAKMKDGTFYGMTEQQEELIRKHRLYTYETNEGWGWSSDVGEDFGYETEQEAFSHGVEVIEDY